MSTGFEDVKANATQLPEMERAEFDLFLMESLDGLQDRDTDLAWWIEIERRIAQIERGDVQLIPGDDVLVGLLRRLD